MNKDIISSSNIEEKNEDYNLYKTHDLYNVNNINKKFCSKSNIFLKAKNSEILSSIYEIVNSSSSNSKDLSSKSCNNSKDSSNINTTLSLILKVTKKVICCIFSKLFWKSLKFHKICFMILSPQTLFIRTFIRVKNNMRWFFDHRVSLNTFK